MQDLVTATQHPDTGCVSMMKEGAPLLGHVECSPSAQFKETDEAESIAELARSTRHRNIEFLASLREDKHADFLLSQTESDAELGRMMGPFDIQCLDLDQALLCRRFSREQGVRSNGETTIRAVDEYSQT